MKTLKLFTLILLSNCAFAQIKVTKLTKADIPTTIKYTGHIIDAVKYTDADGDHIVITTETGIVNSKEKDCPDCRNADVYAYNYIIDNTQPKLLWQVHDFTIACPLDVTAQFVKNTFAVTDLNNNGKAEVWLMYRTACRGDVSSASMKIIMYESKQKYAVRGAARVTIPYDNGRAKSYGGTYAFDAAFKSGASEFKKYAEELWKKNIDEH